jgi:hypothetical protein
MRSAIKLIFEEILEGAIPKESYVTHTSCCGDIHFMPMVEARDVTDANYRRINYEITYWKLVENKGVKLHSILKHDKFTDTLQKS